MQNNGWVKLHRAQFDNWVSEKKPWCDGYAWCYLYSQANHKKGIVNFRNEYIEVQRGQFITSIRKLGDIFGWCRGRVQSYLFILEKDAQIVQQTSHRYTVVTICNYERYQSRAIPKEDSKKDTDIHPEVASDKPQDSINKKPLKGTSSNKEFKNLCLEFKKLKESFNMNLYPLIDDFLELTAKGNKRGKITDGRRLKILQSLDEMRQHCIEVGEARLFEHSLTEAIDHDIGNPMYVKAIIRNTLNRIGSEAQENKWDRELAEKEKEARGRIDDGEGFSKME